MSMAPVISTEKAISVVKVISVVREPESKGSDKGLETNGIHKKGDMTISISMPQRTINKPKRRAEKPFVCRQDSLNPVASPKEIAGHINKVLIIKRKRGQ